MLSGISFGGYLDAHFHKREHCKVSCDSFNLCQGGCPLRCGAQSSQRENCTECGFAALIEHITDALRREIFSKDLSLLTGAARRIILDALALNPFCEVFTQHEK